jgi:hypothetical protein
MALSNEARSKKTKGNGVNNMQRQVMIKHFTYYLRKMMKFYELKVQGVPQVLFILLLAVLFGFGFWFSLSRLI